MLAETFLKGWFIIESISGTGLYSLREPLHNVLLTVELSSERAPGIASLGYAFPEGSYVRVQAWANCQTEQEEFTSQVCTTSADKLLELPCRPNEGMWVAGVHYC
jgi:hypothetical protein